MDGGSLLEEVEADGREVFAEAAKRAREDGMINGCIHETDAEAAGAAGGGIAGALGGKIGVAKEGAGVKSETSARQR